LRAFATAHAGLRLLPALQLPLLLLLLLPLLPLLWLLWLRLLLRLRLRLLLLWLKRPHLQGPLVFVHVDESGTSREGAIVYPFATPSGSKPHLVAKGPESLLSSWVALSKAPSSQRLALCWAPCCEALLAKVVNHRSPAKPVQCKWTYRTCPPSHTPEY